MRAYSADLRARVVEAYETGEENQQEVAQRYRVSVRTLQNWVRLQRETGSLAPRAPGGGRSPAFDASGRDALAKAVQAQPDATLAELRETCGTACSTSVVCRTLQGMRLPRKKSARAQLSKSATT